MSTLFTYFIVESRDLALKFFTEELLLATTFSRVWYCWPAGHVWII
jgi:hypothetical protein